MVEEHRFDLALVAIPHRRFVDRVVLEGVQKHNRAMKISHVQVTKINYNCVYTEDT